MNGPMTYTFTSGSDDPEVAMIEVAYRALSTLETSARSRAVHYVAQRIHIEQALNEVYSTPNTHTHGLDDIACPERLVGECVIEREVAHAVALEREKVAAWLEKNIGETWQAERRAGGAGVAWELRVYFDEVFTPPHLLAAIRNGAHSDEGGN